MHCLLYAKVEKACPVSASCDSTIPLLLVQLLPLAGVTALPDENRVPFAIEFPRVVKERRGNAPT